MLAIKPCETDANFAVAADLARELAAWDSTETAKLGFSAQDVLDFYYEEDGDEPGAWVPPTGLTLLGQVGAEVAGCIAYRQMGAGICELKRFYVRPRFRQSGLGRALVSSLIGHARDAAYGSMRLETVQFMRPAIRMYEAMGFRRRTPYYEIPEVFRPITIFMERDLMEAVPIVEQHGR